MMHFIAYSGSGCSINKDWITTKSYELPCFNSLWNAENDEFVISLSMNI